MKALNRARLLLAALIVPPFACSSDDKLPALGSGGSGGSDTSPPQGGRPTGSPGGDGAVGGAGEQGLGGAALGGASDGPVIGEVGGEGIYPGQAGAPPNPATLCAQDAAWETTPLEGVNTEADERLLALTPDERTLVFARDQQLFVWDDGEASPFTLPAGYSPELGVSLEADGLSLVIVQEEGLSFATVSRLTRSGSFELTPNEAPFKALNEARVTSGGQFSSPVLSAGGESLYFTVRMGTTVANVWRARGVAFAERKLQDPSVFGTEDGQAKLVVGVAADERTLFVFDEALEHVTGMWSPTPAAELTSRVPFEGFHTATPNAACDRIYATTEVSGSLDIVVAAPK
jgi:hypothetical protein